MSEYTYDVFISYSHKDQAWVWEWLLPRLEKANLKVCIDDRDFLLGVPSIVNMERAVSESRHILLVLTPNWVQSEWTNFEAILTQTSDPMGLRRRVIPLLRERADLPPRLASLTHLDLTDADKVERQWPRLLQNLGAAPDKMMDLLPLTPSSKEPTTLSHKQYNIMIETPNAEKQQVRVIGTWYAEDEEVRQILYIDPDGRFRRRILEVKWGDDVPSWMLLAARLGNSVGGGLDGQWWILDGRLYMRTTQLGNPLLALVSKIKPKDMIEEMLMTTREAKFQDAETLIIEGTQFTKLR